MLTSHDSYPEQPKSALQASESVHPTCVRELHLENPCISSEGNTPPEWTESKNERVSTDCILSKNKFIWVVPRNRDIQNARALFVIGDYTLSDFHVIRGNERKCRRQFTEILKSLASTLFSMSLVGFAFLKPEQIQHIIKMALVLLNSK